MNQGTAEVASIPIGHPALQQFCGDDDFRPYLKRPFRYKGHVYASDGRILVRVNDNCNYEPCDIIAVEKILDLEASRIFLKAPAVDIPPKAPTKHVRCADCDGRGKEHGCPDCGCTCETCKGTGTLEERPLVSTTLAGQLFDLDYIRMLYSLPELEIAPNAARSSDKGVSFAPLFFRFAAGLGAVMPLHREYETHVDIMPSKDSLHTAEKRS